MILQYTGTWAGGRTKLLNHPVTGEEIHLDSEQFPQDPSAPKLVEVSDEAAAAIMAQYPTVFKPYTDSTPAAPEIPKLEVPQAYADWAALSAEDAPED